VILYTADESMETTISPSLVSMLRCPIHHSPLDISGDQLICTFGDTYPVFLGIPILLVRDVAKTKFWDSYERLARNECPEAMWKPSVEEKIHPAVQVTIGATSGYMYKHLIGKLQEYPIPEIRVPQSNGSELLDIGCGWGRWSAAAARRGYRVTGIDPDIGLLFTARTVLSQLGLNANFVCADARYLPFADNNFTCVFSYSVIQHFSKEDAKQTLIEVGRVLKSDGSALIQMPNKFGIRSAYHQFRMKIKPGGVFAVRYWSPNELRNTFEASIGPTVLSVDGYFGLGMQPSDARFMTKGRRIILHASETLRQASETYSGLLNLADSLYVHTRKGEPGN
jgi:2-polyprenyl-3-methyl-5-hydroxy-6-metoxy-1,4-benzoquinol methylase